MPGIGPEYVTEKTREGNDTLVVIRDGKRLPLHSTAYPSRESESFRENFDPDRYDLLVVLGTGLGYHLTHLREILRRYKAVVLIDALGGLAERIAANPMTRFLTESAAVRLVHGLPAKDAALAAGGMIDLDSARGVSVLEHPASMRIFPDYYGLVKDSLKRRIDRSAGNMATKKRFGMRYLRNALLNLRDAPEDRPVAALTGAFSGYPAVVVSSAPSVMAHIEAIMARRDEAVLVAVDSALPLMRHYGVSPDMIVIVDPQPYVREHILGSDFRDALAVYSLTSMPLPGLFRNRFCSLNSHPVSQIADRLSGGTTGSVDSATGTVAGDALRCALLAGASAVAMAGFDFSFPRYEIYARGTSYQNRYSLYFQNRLKPVESQNLDYIMKSSGAYRVSGKFTRRSLAGYRDSLSRYAGESAGRVFSINGTGLAVPGIPEASLDEFFARWGRGPVPKKELTASVLAKCARLSDFLRPGDVKSAFDDEGIFTAAAEEALGAPAPAQRKRIKALAGRL